MGRWRKSERICATLIPPRAIATIISRSFSEDEILVARRWILFSNVFQETVKNFM